MQFSKLLYDWHWHTTENDMIVKIVILYKNSMVPFQ